jgi:predicted lipoprotein with Yx(FWY)xxD motif
MSIAGRRYLLLFSALVALGALLGLRAAAARSQPAAAGAGALVEVARTSAGSVLVDARGRALYLYTPDRRGKSACYGTCAKFWPPLTTAAAPRAGRGAKSGLLGVAVRKDGRRQVTYAGHPLYRFAEDRKPGQINGQGFQGIWWLVSPAGRKVTKKAAAPPQPPAPQPPAPQPPSSAAATVDVGSTSLGNVLVAGGRTLYLFTPDANGTSTCYGQCASTWPPLLTSGPPVAGAGVDAALLGTTTRTDGSVQVTYAGHPLYLFARDGAGQTNGEGYGGLWYAVTPGGSKA